MEHLCSRAILLRDGEVAIESAVSEAIARYLEPMGAGYEIEHDRTYKVNRSLIEECAHPDMKITDVSLLSPSKQPIGRIKTGDPLLVRIHYEAKRQFAAPAFAVILKTDQGQQVFQLNTTPFSGYQIAHLGSQGYVDLMIEALPVTAGQYFLDLGFVRERSHWIIRLEEVVCFDVELNDVYKSGFALDRRYGLIVLPHSWGHRIVRELQ